MTEARNSAEALARRALALDPANAEARSCLANALLRGGDHEGAVAEARRALEDDSEPTGSAWCTWSGVDFLGPADRGYRVPGEEHQTRSQRPHDDRSIEPSDDWSLLLARNTNLRLKWRAGRPLLPRVSTLISLACGGTRSTRSDERSERSAGEGYHSCARCFRYACPRPPTVVPTRGPRPYGRRAAKSGLGGLTISLRLTTGVRNEPLVSRVLKQVCFSPTETRPGQRARSREPIILIP